MIDPAEALRAYFDLLHAGQEGWIFAASGTPRLGPSGKVDHPDFEERPFAFPRQLEGLVAHLVSASESRDTWATPGLSHNPTRLLAKRKSLPSRYLWCDLDGAGPPDQYEAIGLASNGGFAVSSGRGAGHLHLYVRLAEPVDAEQLQSWNRRLVAHLHADASPSALNGYLRPPGTLNRKPEVLGTGPAVVVDLHGHGEGPGWELTDLDMRLPARRSSSSAGAGTETISFGTGETAAEPLPVLLPPAVAVILADPADADMDRSARLYSLVVASRAAGLRNGQIVTAAACHAPSVAKYGRRLSVEVARVLAKVQP